MVTPGLTTADTLEDSSISLVTATQMQSLDQRTIREANIPGITLMERAGKGVVQALEQQFGSPSGWPITIFCGKGNNGGDGFVVARLLKQKRAKVRVVLLANPRELTKDAQHMYRRLLKILPSSMISCEPSEQTIYTLASKGHFLIDAMLGTGLSSKVRDPYYTAIQAMNAVQQPTIAVDLPSGIHSDTGEVLGTAIYAQSTVTFGCPKVGLYLGEAIDHVGEIHTVDIGIPREYVKDLRASIHLLTPSTIAPFLPKRNPSAHKGTFGHVGLIAGSAGKTGAAALAARATLRTGAGLVTVATPKSAQPSLDAKLFETMTVAMPETQAHTLSGAALRRLIDFLKGKDVIAIGPGLGTHSETRKMFRQFIPRMKLPCVIDADGLNMLAENLSALSSCTGTPILTPHPGEMARLVGKSSGGLINRDRLGIARQFAKAHKVIIVLKGARTIIASPKGQTAICATGNPGMASAGMGDVLTGVVASLLAQNLTPWDAARTGVCLHGLAGDMAAETVGQAGLIASDLIEHLPYALQKMSSLH